MKFFAISRLKNFRHGKSMVLWSVELVKTVGSLYVCAECRLDSKISPRPSIVATCCQLDSKKLDTQSVINWTVVGQLSRQYRGDAVDSRFVILIVTICLQQHSVARVHRR